MVESVGVGVAAVVVTQWGWCSGDAVGWQWGWYSGGPMLKSNSRNPFGNQFEGHLAVLSRDNLLA